MQQVNEKSTAYLSVTFRDKAGVAQAPTAARYRIDDVVSGLPIRAETAIDAPGASVEITLTVDDNTLKAPSAPRETRRVTVTAEYGAGDAVRSEFLYEVINLTGV